MCYRLPIMLRQRHSVPKTSPNRHYVPIMTVLCHTTLRKITVHSQFPVVIRQHCTPILTYFHLTAPNDFLSTFNTVLPQILKRCKLVRVCPSRQLLVIFVRYLAILVREALNLEYLKMAGRSVNLCGSSAVTLRPSEQTFKMNNEHEG